VYVIKIPLTQPQVITSRGFHCTYNGFGFQTFLLLLLLKHLFIMKSLQSELPDDDFRHRLEWSLRPRASGRMEEGEGGESEAGEPFPDCASRGQSGGHTRKQTEKQNNKFMNKKENHVSCNSRHWRLCNLLLSKLDRFWSNSKIDFFYKRNFLLRGWIEPLGTNFG
jgi:hypothetical protein